MIRITKQTDYGILLLTRLAGDPGRLFTAPELAIEATLPLPMVSKILKALARQGLLSSQRGVKGGYCLAAPAEEISVARVIEAIEGPIGITECIEEAPGECGLAEVCSVRSNWNRINRAIREALAQISLAEMGANSGSAQLVTLGNSGKGAGGASAATR